MRIWIGLLICTLAGCSGCNDDSTGGGAGHPGSGGDHGGAGDLASGGQGMQTNGQDGTGDDADAGVGGPLRVTLSGRRHGLCTGECTELSADVSGGVPGYGYSWSDTALSGPGPHRVCPSSTTNYEVTVSDASFDDEFMDPNDPVTTSLTVEVSDNCDALEEPEELCRVRLGGTDWLYSFHAWGNQLHVADNDDIWLVGHFSGSLDVGTATLQSAGNVDGFMLKLDADCNVLWGRSIGNWGAHLWFTSVGTDSQGNAYLTGQYRGGIDFGDGAVIAPLQQTDGVLLKVDPDGKTLWSRTVSAASATQSTSASVFDVVVDGADRVTVTGYGAAQSDLGAGPIAPNLGQRQIDFLAQFDPSGAVQWQHAVGNYANYAEVEVLPDDDLVLGAWVEQGNDLGTDLWTFDASDTGRYVMRLSPAGEPRWAEVIERPASEQSYLGWWGGGLSTDGLGHIHVHQELLQGDPAGTGEVSWVGDEVHSFTGEGELRWVHGISDTDDGWWDVAMTADADGNVYLMRSFNGTFVHHGVELSSRGDTDIVLIKLSADGSPRWLTHLGDEGGDWGLGADVDGQGQVVVATVSERWVQPPPFAVAEIDVIVRKFAR